MKKIVSFLFGALMLIGFTACEKGLEVNDANLTGSWEMTKITSGNQEAPGGGQIWEFTANHELYVYQAGSEKDYAGEWNLDGKQLTTPFFPFPATVTELTENALVLELREPQSGMVASKYEFEKVK